MRKKLPKGISNYVELVEDGYYYVDKTRYIEKLENLEDKRIMFLRPRKFGKTLFTSVLENYYDLLKKDKFTELFGETYIGKNPTGKQNTYHILRFNFSGIDTRNEETTISGFKSCVVSSIKKFTKIYNLEFNIGENEAAEEILDNLFKEFVSQKLNDKIYVIIDEYDHFANELLGFNTDKFKELVSENGKVRKWYEKLKEGNESVVDRIFITGVAPITLDSVTSGFNIATDISKNIEFNDMLGFSTEDVIDLMNVCEIEEDKQKELLPIIKENYDGYIFSDDIKNNLDKYRIYNSNMTLYFLSLYRQSGEIPSKLIDTNIISDYGKIAKLIDLNKEPKKIELLENIIKGNLIGTQITEKFNYEIKFGQTELLSLLYYLGYLTIRENKYGAIKLGYPNEVIREVYTEYLIEYINRMCQIETIDISDIVEEILLEGKIEKITEKVKEYLTALSNRDFVKFDEKYVKILYYSICKMMVAMFVKSELEVGRGYSDLLLVPREEKEERYAILMEFKYIKKDEYEKDSSVLKQKQDEARKQLEYYMSTEEIKAWPKLRVYSIVTVFDEIYVEEIEK